MQSQMCPSFILWQILTVCDLIHSAGVLFISSSLVSDSTASAIAPLVTLAQASDNFPCKKQRDSISELGLKGTCCHYFFTKLTHLKLVEIFISYERPYFLIDILKLDDPIWCNYEEINDKMSKMHYFLFTTEISRYCYFAPFSLVTFKINIS